MKSKIINARGRDGNGVKAIKKRNKRYIAMIKERNKKPIDKPALKD